MSTVTEEVITETFEVDTGSHLSVSNISGRTAVRATDGSQIVVQATKHGRESAVENTRIEMTQEGNSIRVRTKTDDTGFLGMSRQVCSVIYEIQAPRDCTIHVRGVSADASILGCGSGVQVETVSGDVTVEDISGACSFTSVSGDVHARRLAGSLTLHTTSGDSTVDESQLPHFNCHTVSGDLSIETPLTTQEHYLAKTVSGDLHLLVPEGTGATIQMKSISGDVHSDLPAQIIKSGRRHWQGLINGGGANVEMSTVSGDLRIGASSRLEAVAPMESDKRASQDDEVSSDEASTILEELERGDISVEDALRRLKSRR